MRVVKLKDNLIAIHSDDVKKLTVGKVFTVKVAGISYDLVLESVELVDKKYSFYRYNVICISDSNVKVTEFLYA